MKLQTQAKRLMTAILTGALLLGMTVGCGKRNDEGDTPPPASTTTTRQTTAAATEAPHTNALAEGQAYSKLTGLPTDEELLEQRVICVMFDNHPKARAQAGLSQADIVYEMKVEGTYTRYMGVFQSQNPEKIGSVRSAREYFLDRMQEYDAAYAHVGGAQPALDRIKREGYADLDGLQLIGSAMWRYNDTGKFAPHNVYTDLDHLRQAMENYGYSMTAPEDLQGYPFHETVTPLEGDPASDITIQFAGDNQTRFVYDEDSGKYLRFKDGSADLDENTSEQMSAMNIIVQKANSSIYMAPLKKIDHFGTGEGFYYSQGKVIPITWSKDPEHSYAKTFFFTEDGEELVLNPGQTWIEVIDEDTPLTVKE
jgi:hypothetical protein